MDALTLGLRSLLERVPTGTLPLSRLVDRLRDDGVRVPGEGEGWIHRGAAGEREHFRVLSPWRGPWGERPPRFLAGPIPPAERWILGRTSRPTGYPGQGDAARRMREVLEAWGREVDDARPASVARWVRATQEAECALGVLSGRRGAGG